MLESVKQFLQQFSYLGPKEIGTLLKLTKIKKVKAGANLVNAGEINYNIFLVLKGLIRTYIVRSNGEERTIYLADEGMIAGSPLSAFKKQATNETVEPLEDGWIAMIDILKMEELAYENPKIHRLYSENLKRNLIDAITRVEYLTVMKPIERYQHFQDNYPNLIQRVPQKYLASYLGITPVSLSRIRSRLAK